MLFRCGGDLRVHFLDDRHRAGNGAQSVAGVAGQGDAVVGQVAAAVHDVCHLLSAIVQAEDQPFDLLGRFLSALGQAAHFVGDHRKALAGSARTCRFNGGVQGQQVGLLRNRLDHVQHTGDLLALLLQREHRTA